MTDTDRANKITTYTGNTIDLDKPDPASFNIIDIAHGLSCESRFGGHTKDFYSVAQHSVLVSLLVPPEHALVALLHDATEAYLKDLQSPIKARAPEYKALEKRFHDAICEKFQITEYIDSEIHIADEIMAAAEAVTLLAEDVSGWDLVISAGNYPGEFANALTLLEANPPLAPRQAELLFLNRCKALGGWQ